MKPNNTTKDEKDFFSASMLVLLLTGVSWAEESALTITDMKAR
jgi:hypothetical protein